MKVNIKRLNDGAVVPTNGSQYSAGYDLYANTYAQIVTIAPGQTAKISTGIAMEIPNGYFGAVFARSGLATKQGLRPANCVGVIDADYRGDIVVAIYNDSNEPRIIQNGDRIAQIVVMPYLPIEFNEVDELTDTDRGEGGFGSTGVSTEPQYEQLSLFDMV